MRPALNCSLAAVLLAPVALAAAVDTQTRTFRSAPDFAAGEMDHVSISETGKLQLSPRYSRTAELDEPVAWAAAMLGDDVIVGSGHDGKVFRVPTKKGKPTLLFDATELEVHAVAVAPDGSVYAATSPTGRVYRIGSDGKGAVFFDPEDRYIWAMTVARDGSLYVATGDKGGVYRVAPDGTSRVVLVAEETHILSLALAPDGTLYAGSGGSGYVYRVLPDGATSVLLDTPGSEVKALVLDADGTLFVASTGHSISGPDAVSQGDSGGGAGMTGSLLDDLSSSDSEPASSETRPTTALPEAAPPPPPAPQQPGQAQAQAAATAMMTSAAFGPTGPRHSWLFRIRKDGLPEELWRSHTETVHSMALFRGKVVLGTGDEGKVFAVDPATGRGSILVDLPGAQVTGLTPRGRGLAAVTSNLASVWVIDDEPSEAGTYTSPVIDAGHFATWGRLVVQGSGLGRAAARSGNTQKPGPLWSAWQDASGAIPSPRARFLQYRLRLGGREREDEEVPMRAPAPELTSVEVSFLPYNLAPRLKGIAVLGPHVQLVSTSPSEATLGSGRASGRGRSKPGSESRSAPREAEAHGARSARFDADDPNKDDLSFTVWYRGEDEREWKLISDELDEPFVSFDSTAFPDGSYVLKVEASDQPSNADAAALTSQLVSDPFTIDNAPPRVEVKHSRREPRRLHVRAEVKDQASVLRSAEYALDGGPWRALRPDDQVFDQREETISFEIADVDDGEHTVVVRAEDAARNVGSGKTVVAPR